MVDPILLDSSPFPPRQKSVPLHHFLYFSCPHWELEFSNDRSDPSRLFSASVLSRSLAHPYLIQRAAHWQGWSSRRIRVIACGGTKLEATPALLVRKAQNR